MHGQKDAAGAVDALSVMRSAERSTDFAMGLMIVCPACGYPKFGPGLCAFCLPRARA